MVALGFRSRTEGVELLDLIKVEHISFLDVSSKEEAIKSLIDNLYKNSVVEDKDSFYRAVLEREKVVSTGIGMGLAIPHAKTDEATDFFLSIGLLPQGIDWQGIDGLKVKLVFLIGGPKSKPREYLRLLSELTKLMKDEKRRSSFMNAKDEMHLVSIFHSCYP